MRSAIFFWVRGVLLIHFFTSSHSVQIASITHMALNYAKKMKAGAPALRQTLIHELVREFSMRLRSLRFNDRRDAAFRWIERSLQTTLDSRPIIKRTTATTTQQATWLNETAPLDPAWKKRVRHS